MDEINAMSTTSKPEPATFVWENTELKEQRRSIYYIMHGLVGLFTVIITGFILLGIILRRKIRAQVSLMMMNVIVFCFIHGWIVGIIYPLQRVYRMTMSEGACIFTTLVMDFADNYILILLPGLAIERLISIRHPHADPKKVKIWTMASMILVFVVTILISWVPLIPGLDVPTTAFIESNNTDRTIGINAFYKAYTCNFKINRKNVLAPVFIISVEVVCVLTVIGVNVVTVYMMKKKLSNYASLTNERQLYLKHAWRNIMIVAAVFILTFLPYGVIYHYRDNCGTNVSDRENSLCNTITIELRFVFSILAHVGNLLAPLLFILMNKHLRKSLKAFGTCSREFESAPDVEFVSTLTESRINISSGNNNTKVGQ